MLGCFYTLWYNVPLCIRFFFSQHSCSRETVNVLMNVSKMRTSTQMGWNLAQNINCGAQFDLPKTEMAQLKVFEFPVGSK